MMPATDVALLTDHRFVAPVAEPGDWYLANILTDDALLAAALARRGLTSVRVDWADPAIDWTRFRVVVFRTTWDYFDRREEFRGWLDRLAAPTQVCNPVDVVIRNMDKHYLAELAAAGVPVVPGRYLERGARCDLAAVLAESGWAEAVVKPCVSGAARHTYRVSRGNAADLDAVVGPLLAQESFLVQPFLGSVPLHGEDSLMLFRGRFTHAVRKRAKPGDFRVQDDHGGTVTGCSPTAEQIELAQRAVSALQPAPAYGRVDMACDDDGRWVVMEVELIEPELWLRSYPPAADAFADEIASTLLTR
jgi:glutathione synthase/RimK-type ligase-like ATP-grasp enzyme